MAANPNSAPQTPDDEKIDLDKEIPGPSVPIPTDSGSEFGIGGYNSLPHEDKARRCIAYLLIGLLIGICIVTFFTLWWTSIPVEDIIRVLQVVLGPIIALVSAATGFYYGTKSKQ